MVCPSITPLCENEDSTMKILSTTSCCSRRVISKVSTSNEKRIIKTIFLGFKSLSPVSPGCFEQLGNLKRILCCLTLTLTLSPYLTIFLGLQVVFTSTLGGMAATSAITCRRLEWGLLSGSANLTTSRLGGIVNMRIPIRNRVTVKSS